MYDVDKLRLDENGNHIYSFYGLVGYWESDKLKFKNKNFTSTTFYSNTYMMSLYTKGYRFFCTIGSRGRS